MAELHVAEYESSLREFHTQRDLKEALRVERKGVRSRPSVKRKGQASKRGCGFLQKCSPQDYVFNAQALPLLLDKLKFLNNNEKQLAC